MSSESPTSTQPINYGGESHDVAKPTPHHKVNYVAIFILLIVLTIVTVSATLFGLKSEVAKITLALTIASIKAAFVAIYFMHLKFEGKLIYACLVVPVVLTIILICALLPDQVTAFHAMTPQ